MTGGFVRESGCVLRAPHGLAASCAVVQWPRRTVSYSPSGRMWRQLPGGPGEVEERPSFLLFILLPVINALGKNLQRLRASVMVRRWGRGCERMLFWRRERRAESQAGSIGCQRRRKKVGAVTGEAGTIKKYEENHPLARGLAPLVSHPASHLILDPTLDAAGGPWDVFSSPICGGGGMGTGETSSSPAALKRLDPRLPGLRRLLPKDSVQF